MSLECSSFIVLQSELPSPLFSILYFLPKDQTLKRFLSDQGIALCYRTLLTRHMTNTKGVFLSVIPEDRSSASSNLLARRPCSVITRRTPRDSKHLGASQTTLRRTQTPRLCRTVRQGLCQVPGIQDKPSMKESATATF